MGYNMTYSESNFLPILQYMNRFSQLVSHLPAKRCHGSGFGEIAMGRQDVMGGENFDEVSQILP